MRKFGYLVMAVAVVGLLVCGCAKKVPPPCGICAEQVSQPCEPCKTSRPSVPVQPCTPCKAEEQPCLACQTTPPSTTCDLTLPCTEVQPCMTPVPELVTCANPSKSVLDGGQAMARGRYQKAIELLSCAIETGRLNQDELAKAYNWRGLAYCKNGDCKIAVADFSDAIKIFPDYDAAYKNRSVAYQKCGAKAQAMADRREYKRIVAEAKKKGVKPRKMALPGKCKEEGCKG